MLLSRDVLLVIRVKTAEHIPISCR